jgi:hypothetical protein
LELKRSSSPELCRTPEKYDICIYLPTAEEDEGEEEGRRSMVDGRWCHKGRGKGGPSLASIRSATRAPLRQQVATGTRLALGAGSATAAIARTAGRPDLNGVWK